MIKTPIIVYVENSYLEVYKDIKSASSALEPNDIKHCKYMIFDSLGQILKPDVVQSNYLFLGLFKTSIDKVNISADKEEYDEKLLRSLLLKEIQQKYIKNNYEIKDKSLKNLLKTFIDFEGFAD